MGKIKSIHMLRLSRSIPWQIRKAVKKCACLQIAGFCNPPKDGSDCEYCPVRTAEERE